MIERIKENLSDISFYPLLWILTGLLGSIQRSYSPSFDQWFQQSLLEVEKQGYEPNVMDLIGTSPLFVVIAESLSLFFCMGLFAFFHLILRKKMPNLLKYLICLFPTSIVAYTGYIAVDALIENLKWGFYILAIQDVVWGVYLWFVVSSYWKLINQTGEWS